MAPGEQGLHQRAVGIMVTPLQAGNSIKATQSGANRAPTLYNRRSCGKGKEKDEDAAPDERQAEGHWQKIRL